MTPRLDALCVDARDPDGLARFWAGVLGWERSDEAGDPVLLPDDDTGFRLRFLPTQEPKTVPNQMHFDLTSTSLEDQAEKVERAIALGFGALASDGTRQVGYFWSEALGWPLVWDQDEETAIRSPHGGPKITWGGPPLAPRAPKNRWHFDLAPTDGDQAATVERLVSLGASRADTGQGAVDQVVLADPDGNVFCVLPAR
jgi:catechol 2,3-dioxygenase-like lactoylglutathione lyase family enzyme